MYINILINTVNQNARYEHKIVPHFLRRNGGALYSGNLLRPGDGADMFLHNGTQIPGTR